MNLDEVIAESRSLLDLPDEWDDEGAERIQVSTWISAMALLKMLNEQVRRDGFEWKEFPNISACPDGSIDLVWICSDGWASVLINVKKDGGFTYVAYDDIRDTFPTIKGHRASVFDPGAHLYHWMIRNRTN